MEESPLEVLKTPPAAPVKVKRRIKPQLVTKEESEQDKLLREQLIGRLKKNLYENQYRLQRTVEDMRQLIRASNFEVRQQQKKDGEICLLCDKTGRMCQCEYEEETGTEVYLKLVLKQKGEKIAEANLTSQEKIDIH